MAQQEHKGQSQQYKGIGFQPKLRRNRKIEMRWGNRYHEAVKTAVFNTHNSPYTPADPPRSIREEIDKTGYVCKQCRDCFRFLSSIEEHTSRRSWVLGFWCQQCFLTTCTHKASGKPNCPDCTELQMVKHDYLLNKGMKKNLKKGVTRVFYNQCQFFAHLRMHGTATVDLSEVMLMPLPSGIQPEHYAQLDKIWKALMEVMFIRRIHIMDWVKDKKIAWDAVLNSTAKQYSLVADIVSRYSEDCAGGVDNKSDISRQDNPIQFEDSRRAVARGSPGNRNQSRLANSDEALRLDSVQIISTKVRKEMKKEEEKFVPSAIAFVDCGRASDNCISETVDAVSTPDSELLEKKNISSDVVADKKSATTQKKSTSLRDNSSWRSVSQFRAKSRDETRKSGEDRSETSPLGSINQAGHRVLTIRSPKNLSLSTIMKHLPNDTSNRKKIVVVAENADSKVGLSGSGSSGGLKRKPNRLERLESSFEESGASLVPIAVKEEARAKAGVKSKLGSTNILVEKSKAVSLPGKVTTQSFSEQMSLHGKIVFQNGRKYIIRHVPKLKYQSSTQTALATKNIRGLSQISKTIPVSKRLLLPKPVDPSSKKPPATTLPVTVSGTAEQKSIIINRQLKNARFLPIVTTPSTLSLVPFKTNSSQSSSKTKVIKKLRRTPVAKIQDSMQNELHNVSKKELEAYIENLKGINEAYSKAMGFENDSVVSSNLKTIQRFEKLASLASTPKSDPASEPVPESTTTEPTQSEDSFLKNARDWELLAKNTAKKDCETCGKTLKPSSYIVGMSGPASNESSYCQCYNNICHLCNINQRNLLQLKAHVKWHQGEKPFMCPDCAIVFESASELEVHVWTTCFHPMSRHMYGCGVCEIEGMLDMESVARHFFLLHTRRKIICAECKMEYSEKPPTELEHKHHFAKHHPNVKTISEPRQLFLCNLKQCVVRPEYFRAHLADHTGLQKWIYYKCPFCLMITQGTVRNKTMMREHLVKNHLDRLHEVVSPESLDLVLKGIQFPVAASSSNLQSGESSSVGDLSSVTNASIEGPVIVNARSITPASFEHCSESSQERPEESASLPRILDVRSEATDEFETSDSTENDCNVRIVAVESIAANDEHPESPASKSETSDAVSSRESTTSDELAFLSEDHTAAVGPDPGSGSVATLKIRSSSLKEYPEDNSSLSNEAVTLNVISEREEEMESSPPKLSRKPESLGEELEEWKVHERSPRKSPRRPWRIALNSPTSQEGEPVAYNCHLCGELINTSWSVIKSHFSSRHASDYELSVLSTQIPQITSGFIEGGYRDDCGMRKRKNEAGHPVTPGSKRRRRWGPKKFFEKPGSPSLGLCVRPEPVLEVEGSFRCKKCDEAFEQIATLREHIATNHRIKGQYLICLECGENFVVVPSLQMHLKALHGIQDPITYLTQNTAYAPDTPEDTDEEERSMEANQCYVCMAVFEDKAAVEKHIRVHGMAFLKRKRFEAQKAQKFSEKKGEPPDNSGALSPESKFKGSPETSKTSSLGTSESNSEMGSPEDKKKDVQSPLKFWVKKFDTSDSSNTSASSDEKSQTVQDGTAEGRGNEAEGTNAT